MLHSKLNYKQVVLYSPLYEIKSDCPTITSVSKLKENTQEIDNKLPPLFLTFHTSLSCLYQPCHAQNGHGCSSHKWHGP